VSRREPLRCRSLDNRYTFLSRATFNRICGYFEQYQNFTNKETFPAQATVLRGLCDNVGCQSSPTSPRRPSFVSFRMLRSDEFKFKAVRGVLSYSVRAACSVFHLYSGQKQFKLSRVTSCRNKIAVQRKWGGGCCRELGGPPRPRSLFLIFG
jgi:hypothetical protein